MAAEACLIQSDDFRSGQGPYGPSREVEIQNISDLSQGPAGSRVARSTSGRRTFGRRRSATSWQSPGGSRRVGIEIELLLPPDSGGGYAVHIDRRLLQAFCCSRPY